MATAGRVNSRWFRAPATILPIISYIYDPLTKDRRVATFRVNDVSTLRMVNTGGTAGGEPARSGIAVILAWPTRPPYSTGGGIAGGPHPLPSTYTQTLRSESAAARRTSGIGVDRMYRGSGVRGPTSLVDPKAT